MPVKGGGPAPDCTERDPTHKDVQWADGEVREGTSEAAPEAVR